MSLFTAIYVFLLIELSFISYLDIKYRKIKNFWSILNLLISGFLFIFHEEIYPFELEAFQFGLVFLFPGFLLYMLKIMGGGESKFLANFFILVPFKEQEIVFYYLLIITIIVGLIFFLRSIFMNIEKIVEGFKIGDIKMIKGSFGKKFPFAPVIWLTWIWYGLEKFYF